MTEDFSNPASSKPGPKLLENPVAKPQKIGGDLE